jgi:hypothetical protein
MPAATISISLDDEQFHDAQCAARLAGDPDVEAFALRAVLDATDALVLVSDDLWRLHERLDGLAERPRESPAALVPAPRPLSRMDRTPNRRREMREQQTETAQELTAESKGRWLVTTQGTRHIWDLDAMTYARFPGLESLRGACMADATDLPIVLVRSYPKIGESSEVFCSNPDEPGMCHWRRSSTVARIERLDAIEEL